MAEDPPESDTADDESLPNDDRPDADQTDAASVAGSTAASRTYKVLGSLTDPDGVGVLGRNDAATGTPIAVEGVVPNAEGYGIATPAHARVEGDLSTTSGFTVSIDGDDALRIGARETDAVGRTAGGTVVAGYGGNGTQDAGEGSTVGATIAGGGRSGSSTVGESTRSDANQVTGSYGAVGGGITNRAGQEAVVAGGSRNAADRRYAVVGGGVENAAGARWAAVAGGRANDAGSSYGAVGGGRANVVAAAGGTVAGGEDNAVGGSHAAVGGGRSNVATATGGTVAGGEDNDAGGSHAAVTGGEDNNAGGSHAAIPGGKDNRAEGRYSFAAGRDARAEDVGVFIWADNETDAEGNHLTFFSSRGLSGNATGPNTFHARATGGVRFVTDVYKDSSEFNKGTPKAGVYLASGGSSWQTVSAEAVKHDVSPVDSGAVLEGVESLELSTWAYDSRPGVTHMGPMAGEFHEAFGLGDDPRTIGHVDADGVALAAIQGLSRKLDDREERVDRLERELAAKGERVDRLEGALDAKDDRIDRLEEELREKDARIDALDAESAAGDERLAALEERLADLESRVETAARTSTGD